MLVLNNYFCKNRKSKLHFGDRVAVLNVFFYQIGGSTRLENSRANRSDRAYIEIRERRK
jgi:hypothetical protein